jgi:hypothetical protein
MTKLEKLQKEYPMFELAIRPVPNSLKEAYIENGYEPPKRMLMFIWKGTNSEEVGSYSDWVGDFDSPIASLRESLDHWVSKI